MIKMKNVCSYRYSGFRIELPFLILSNFQFYFYSTSIFIQFTFLLNFLFNSTPIYVRTHIFLLNHVHEHLYDFDLLSLHVYVVTCFALASEIRALIWSLVICLSVVYSSHSFLDVKT